MNLGLASLRPSPIWGAPLALGASAVAPGRVDWAVFPPHRFSGAPREFTKLAYFGAVFFGRVCERRRRWMYERLPAFHFESLEVRGWPIRRPAVHTAGLSLEEDSKPLRDFTAARRN